MKKMQKKYILLYIVIALCFLLFGCGEESEQTFVSSNEKGARDNTPMIRMPIASGTTVFSGETSTIDASYAEEGYIMANYTGTNKKVKLQLTGPDGTTYTYNLHGNDYEVFPLTAGDGTYTIGIYENISDTKYVMTMSTDINVSLADPLSPYLYPNQYVNYNASSLPIEKAASLSYSANTDLEVVEKIYNYIVESFTYDYEKAKSVTSGYLPVIDEVYQAGTGICFDYAAVITAMLRSQNIPTRLEVGYVGEQYHAWISVYIEELGWINGIIEFHASAWTLLDPTFASTSESPKDFLTETDKYTTKYIY